MSPDRQVISHTATAARLPIRALDPSSHAIGWPVDKREDLLMDYKFFEKGFASASRGVIFFDKDKSNKGLYGWFKDPETVAASCIAHSLLPGERLTEKVEGWINKQALKEGKADTDDQVPGLSHENDWDQQQLFIDNRRRVHDEQGLVQENTETSIYSLDQREEIRNRAESAEDCIKLLARWRWNKVSDTSPSGRLSLSQGIPSLLHAAKTLSEFINIVSKGHNAPLYEDKEEGKPVISCVFDTMPHTVLETWGNIISHLKTQHPHFPESITTLHLDETLDIIREAVSIPHEPDEESKEQDVVDQLGQILTILGLDEQGKIVSVNNTALSRDLKSAREYIWMLIDTAQVDTWDNLNESREAMSSGIIGLSSLHMSMIHARSFFQPA